MYMYIALSPVFQYYKQKSKAGTRLHTHVKLMVITNLIPRTFSDRLMCCSSMEREWASWRVEQQTSCGRGVTALEPWDEPNLLHLDRHWLSADDKHSMLLLTNATWKMNTNNYVIFCTDTKS